MQISGLQKMTLLDFPGRIACTVFTRGCNYRCPFCHNASLVVPERMDPTMDAGAVLSFLESRVGLLDGVVVSGGEATLQDGLEAFLRAVKGMGYAVKLDTNGSRPEILRDLCGKGLVDRVAMDIKNAPELYGVTSGRADVDIEAVRQSRDFLLEGHVSAEFRTTVVKGLHTEESLMSAARFIEGAKEYYLQKYRDTGNVILPDGLSSFTDARMQELLCCVQTVIPEAALRGVG